MTFPSISVVIPAYNTGSYIDRTLRNIAEEQFRDYPSGYWEIIVVNDGSTDGTEATAQEWAKRFPGNIRVITQPNHGVSAARNRGIDEASGEYIYFMDSDDLLRQRALPDLGNACDRSKADMIAFNFDEISEEQYARYSEEAPERLPLSSPIAMSGVDYMLITDGLDRYFCPYAACCVFFRKKFLIDNQLRYSTKLAMGEDTLFNINALLVNPRVAWITEQLYIYNCLRTGNASSGTDRNYMTRAAKKRIDFMIEASKALNAIRSRHDVPRNIMRVILSSIIHSYYMTGTYLLMTNAPVSALLHLRRIFKNAGGKAGLGRPKFVSLPTKPSFSLQVRRWLFAYPVMGIAGVSDYICGRGLWRTKKSKEDAIAISRSRAETAQRKPEIAQRLRVGKDHRRILVFTDTYDHQSEESHRIDSYALYNTEILIYAHTFSPGSFEYAVSRGYFPFEYRRFNGMTIDSVADRSYFMANMAAVQGVDEILLYPVGTVDTAGYELTCPITLIARP